MTMKDSASSCFSDFVSSDVNKLPLSFKQGDAAGYEKLVRDAARGGIKPLKAVIRRLNLPPTHPFRKNLWPLLISTRYGVNIQTEQLSDDGSAGSPEDGRASLAGYELADQSLVPTYFLNDNGKNHLLRILHSVAASHPELVYAPQLWPILALFLHYHSEPVARACLLAVLERAQIVTQTKGEWKEQCLALEHLGRFLPRTVTRSTGKGDNPLVHAGNSIHLQLAVWVLAIWDLPFGHLVRLIDCLLLEGRKILFRAGLLLWKRAYKISLNGPNTAPESLNLTEAARSVSVSPAAFLKRMFSIINFSSNDIRKATERVRQLGDRSVPESSLIHPFVKDGANTFIGYLSDETSAPATYVHPSQCVTSSELAAIIRAIALPRLVQLCKPVLIFSSNVHGVSLQTLFNRAAATSHPESILLIRTSSGQSVIGAFCSDQWQIPGRPTYFGTGTCFVFRIKPGPIAIFPWVGVGDENATHDTSIQSFQYASTEGLKIGAPSGCGLSALGLDNRLSTGTSAPSVTFGNVCLVGYANDIIAQFGSNKEGCSFSVGLVELIGFEDL